MEADLFAQEVKEDVHVATHGSHVQVGVVRLLLLVTICTKENEKFDALVGTVHDCERHDSVVIAFELFVKYVDLVDRVFLQHVDNISVVLDHCVMKRAEVFLHARWKG